VGNKQGTIKNGARVKAWPQKKILDLLHRHRYL